MASGKWRPDTWQRKRNTTSFVLLKILRILGILFIMKLHAWFSIQAWILVPDIGQRPAKIELCPKEAASQWTKLSGVKLNKIISYQRLKTQKHSVSIGLYCFGVFMKILIDNLLMQFFHIPNRTMCLSKKVLYQLFAVFFALLGTASPMKTFFTSLHSTKNSKKIQTTPNSLNW